MSKTDELRERQISESDLYLALEDLVIYTLKRQINDVLDKNKFDVISWAKEACTVRFQGPRQCGHSSAVVKLCQYIFRNPLVIVPYVEGVDLIKEKFNSVSTPQIINLNMLENYKEKFKYDGIIVDDVSCVNPVWIEKIYMRFSKFAYGAGSFCFVLLG